MSGNENPLAEIAEHIDAPVSPATGIAAIALGMSMKYHDINTIQEGALYQQYKLEGKNIQPLYLDMVLHTAERIEAWLLNSPSRLSKIVIDAICEDITDALEDDAPNAEEQPA